MADYYDIEDILAEDERIPCTFNIGAWNLGYLDASRHTPDIEEGTKVDIPIWMATALAKRGMVTVGQPASFDVTVRNELKVKPEIAKLRLKGAYYYEVGQALCRMSEPGTDLPMHLPAVLLSVLARRFVKIFDDSTNSPEEDTTKMMQDLTNLERTLFETGYNATNTLFQWKTRDLTFLSAAPFFEASSSRRRMDRRSGGRKRPRARR